MALELSYLTQRTTIDPYKWSPSRTAHQSHGVTELAARIHGSLTHHLAAGSVRRNGGKMSIKARIEDAELLWQLGRKEGAWVLALIAAAATSRKRYPKPIPDNKAFKSFIRDVLPTLVFGKSIESSTPNPSIIFDKTPVEDIVYEHLRCNLLHEATLSQQVPFSESKIMDGKVQGTIVVGSPNMIPGFWVLHLIKAVRDAPENVSDFTENT